MLDFNAYLPYKLMLKIKEFKRFTKIYTVGFCGGKPPHFCPISGDPHLKPPF
jgi:hypothetical protein